MRTLKKTLCLVLCLVMMVGLCAFGASAEEFTDADKIEHKEAVGLLTGLGVINGMGDGTFAPAATLNRAQAAKIVTYLLGYEDIKGSSTFTDIPAAMKDWAEGPISLCASLGIVNGVGDNKFDPEGTLTGSAWGKMVLCALGYNAEYEGMTGIDWEIGVAKTLKNTGLLAGLTGLDLAKAISRDDACQMAFNALSEQTKKFKPGMNIAGTNLSVTSTGEYDLTYAGKSLGQTVFGLSNPAGGGANAAKVAPFYGRVIDTPATVANQKYTTLYDVNTAANVKIALDLDGDMIGKVIKVYYKYAAAEPTTGYVVYSYEDLTTEVTVTARTKAAAKLAAFKAAGITADPAANSYQTVANGTIGANVAVPVDIDANAVAAEAGVYYIGPTSLAVSTPKVWSLAKGDDLHIGFVNAIVTTAGAESIDIQGASTDSVGANPVPGVLANTAANDRVREYEGIARYDLVAYTLLGNVYNLFKTSKVEGKVTAFDKFYQTITMDGKTYSASAADTIEDIVAADINGITPVWLSALTAGNSYVLYLDQDGDVFAVSATADATTDAVFVNHFYTKNAADEYGTVTATNYLQCIDSAGKEVNYVTTLGGNPGKGVKILTLDGKNRVTAVANPAVPACFGNTAGATFAATAKSHGGDYFASDVKFIYVQNTGANLKVQVKDGVQAITTDDVYWVGNTVSGVDYIKVMYVNAAPEIVATGTGLMYVKAAFTQNSVTSVKNKNTAATIPAYKQTVWIDGVKTDILVDGTEQAAVNAEGFYTYTIDDATGLYDLTGVTATRGRINVIKADLTLATGTAKGDLLTCANPASGNTSATGTNAAASGLVITDMICTDAVVVNTTADTTLPTTIAGIKADTTNTYDLAIATVTNAQNVTSVTYVYIHAAA